MIKDGRLLGSEIRLQPDSDKRQKYKINGICVRKVDSSQKTVSIPPDHHKCLKNERALKSVRNTDVMFSLVYYNYLGNHSQKQSLKDHSTA